MPLKYAVVERERRFLVGHIPNGVVSTRQIVDRYVEGTRLRLREVTDDDGTITRKLGHKARLNKGPEEVACTSMYLDDAEWQLLCQLPALVLRASAAVESCTSDNVEVYVQTEVLHDALSERRRLRSRHG